MDHTDRKMLAILQEDGRISNAELARRLSLAPSTSLERLRRLEQSGALRAIRADIDPASLGYGVMGFIMVTLDRHDVEVIRAFESHIEKTPNVRACHHITGRFDYLLHVGARDLQDMGEVVKTRIAAIPGIGKVETFLMLSEVKRDQGWPVELPADEPHTK